MKRIRLLVLLALTGLIGAPVLAQSAPADLMKFIPATWPVVAQIDTSSGNASGAYLKSVAQKADYQDLKQLNASFATGVSRMLSALGVHLGTRDGLFPWWGERIVIGIDPLSDKNPGVIVAIASTDRSAAEKTMSELIGSFLRDSDPVVQEISGAKVLTWKIPGEKVEPAYAIGDGFVLFADSAARVKAALVSPSATPPAVAAGLAKHPDALVSFAVDLGGVLAGKNAGATGEDMEAGMMAMATSQMKADGGITLNEHGALLTANGDLPPMVMMMLSQFLKPGASPVNLAESMPREALAYAALSSGAGIAEQGLLKNEMEKGQMAAAALFLKQAGASPVGAALMAFIPQPSIVLIAQTAGPAEASAMVTKLENALRLQKFTLKPRGELTNLVCPQKDGGKSAGYLAQIGPKVILASDLRSMQKAREVTAEDSLATRAAFAGVGALVGPQQAVNAWVSLDAVSALGYMYEGMVGREMATVRPLLDMLKGTEGIGLSVGTAGNAATLKLGIKTTITPQSLILRPYMAAIPAALLFTGFERARTTAQASDSLSNLKQLAVALSMYSTDHDDMTPPSKTWRKALEPYIKDKSVFMSPSTGQEYVYNYKAAGLKMSQIDADPSELIIFFEGDPDAPVGPDALIFSSGRGAAVAYLDGHCAWLNETPTMDAFRAIKTPVKPAKPVKKR